MKSGNGACPVGEGGVLCAISLLAAIVATGLDPARVFDAYQRDPRSQQIQAHLPAGQAAFDGHVHGIDVRPDLAPVRNP